MKLTKEIKQRHFELWNWLVKNPSKEKGEHPNWEFNDGTWEGVIKHCFLCELFNDTYKNVTPPCSKCPLTKLGQCCIDKDLSGMNDSSWYRKWEKAKTSKTRKKYAKLIRDIFKEEQ